MNKAVLACHNLAKSYHDAEHVVNVLTQVNLQVQPAEFIVIMGSSGSGKSTLLHLLGGLDKPNAGQVLVAGQDLAALSEKEKCRLRNRHLGFVFQFHHLLPEFTALENVAMPLLLRQEKPEHAKQQAEYLLGLVGLQQRLTHKMGELSGGERQRVAIARALVTRPVCVLADEPTGNLDRKNAEHVLEIFFNLQETLQTSVVMVTHDATIAERGQRVLTLQDGLLQGYS